MTTPIPAAGVVCLRGAEILLVRRAKPPRMNDWSLPGGRIEWGERAADAALRELREETGVEADLLGLIDVIDFLAEERHFVLVDFAAVWRSGEPVAGDDAADARFWTRDEALALVGWAETARVIREAIDRFGKAAR